MCIRDRQTGDIVTHTITATADAEQDSDSVAINIIGQPRTQLMLPSVSNRIVAGEPNNGACNALALMPNINHYFLPDDANDWYRFSLPSAARVRIVLSNFSAGGQIVIYSGDCAGPTFLQNNGNFEPTKIIDLGQRQAGPFLIWVITDSRFSDSAPYTLRIETSAP